MKNDSIYRIVFWISHQSRRPVKNVPAAENLAATEGIDESKLIASAYKQLLNIGIRVKIVVDSKDLFTSLATQRNSINRSTSSDVACTRYEFQVGWVDEISWIQGKLNLADVLKKPDSPLREASRLVQYTRRLQVDCEP